MVVKGQELGSLEKGTLLLDKPVRSQGLRLVGEGEPGEVLIYGLEVRELPEHEGFKRH